MSGAERRRVEGFGALDHGLRQAGPWYLWGPYVSERQWGTVREDYSADGDAWRYLPHDHARSRAYRWGEDGMAGFSDVEQNLCIALALWNGRDPILKERMFGLDGFEGNHGEDVKEYWWYLDAVPSHAWNRWRYHYPQRRFPYEDLVAGNAARSRLEPEYELLDTGVFDGDRYWIVDVDYAKADPTDLLMAVRVTNAGPDPDVLHVLPTAWFRDTWSWDPGACVPELRLSGSGRMTTAHPFLGDLEWRAGPGPDGSRPTPLFCDNATNRRRLFGETDSPPYPKDGINDHVVTGMATVNPAGRGTKAAFWYRLEVPPGATVEVRLRLGPVGPGAGSPPDDPLGAGFDRVTGLRRREADEFYAELAPEEASSDEAMVMRQAFSSLLWSKQFYAYDVSRWLDGDPGQPPPPPERLSGRNCRWRNFEAFDILAMPDKWEYPWFAAWDMAFHCVGLAHLDPAFAKYQLLLLCREWFQHPSGAIPAYEWDFGDVNPPVQAWAALEVFAIDGARDIDFLSLMFDKLLINFTWWINLEDSGGSNLFEGGFLGLDNIGPLDRSHLPVDGVLEQSDATGWMAYYSLTMATICGLLHRAGARPAGDLAIKFLEHFAQIARAMDRFEIWDEADGFYYDKLVRADGSVVPVKVRSMVGVIPLMAAAVVDERMLARATILGKQFSRMLEREGLHDHDRLAREGLLRGEPGRRRLLLGVVGVDRIEKLLAKLLDEGEFLSPYGLRALSAHHRNHPYTLDVDGLSARIGYEPAESTTGMFGGNSNWRGPVWFPLNYLLISAIHRYDHFFGAEFQVPYPTGSGRCLPLAEIGEDLRRRLIGLFLVGPDGRRPCFGNRERFQHDPRWRDNLLFHEYFHGDTGEGLGASHQTGWTALVADLIRGRSAAGVYAVNHLGDVFPGPAEPRPRPFIQSAQTVPPGSNSAV